jgi:DNA-3-methyladenine glycosylase I
MADYHDSEWGVPAHGDSALFERLALESFQAGLSWSTILHRRRGFREAFAGFDPAIVASFGPADVERLVVDAGIVRNRAKIQATIANARGVLEIARESGSFDAWLWAHVQGPPRRLPAGATRADVPTADPAALRLSRELRVRGFRFVGPTIVYAFMQSVGMVNDHLPTCWRYGG